MILGKIKTYVIMGLIVLLPVAFMKGCQEGETREQAKQIVAADKLRDELLAQHKISMDAVQSKNELLKSKRRTSDVKLGKLLKENAALKSWWDTTVPDDAIDYIYGVYNSESDKQVPGR